MTNTTYHLADAGRGPMPKVHRAAGCRVRYALVGAALMAANPAAAQQPGPVRGQPEAPSAARAAAMTGGDAAGAVQLDEISVETRTGAARLPPRGTVGQPPAAFAGGQVASGGRSGFLDNRSVFDTPFTTANYTAELIRDQQAQSVADVLRNNPSVREQQPPFSTQQNLSIRGLFVNARDTAFDGLYGIASVFRPAVEGIERVEVLSGPGAFLFGFPPGGSAVGVVNLVPKRAADAPLTRITAQYLGSSTVGGAFDVGRRFGDGNAVGVRINGAYRDGATPIDHQNQDLGVLTLGLDLRGDAFRVSFDAGYQHLDFDAESNSLSVLPGFAIPRPPRLSRNLQQPWERSDINHGFAALRAEYDPAPDVTLFGAIGGSIARRSFFTTDATVTDAAGTLLQDTRTIAAENQQWTGEVGLRGRFKTGPIDHAPALVVTHYAAREPFDRGPGPEFQSRLYDPIIIPRPERSIPARLVTGLNTLDGIAVTDTASILDGRIQLIAGGRFQTVKQDYALPGGGFSSRYDKVAASPMAALIVKPLADLSLYASYAEGFGFGPTAPLEARNANAAFPPIVTSQIETGAKLDLGTVGLALAFYEIKQPSGFLNPETRIFGLYGEQRNRGVDLSVFGSPAEGVRWLGGVTLLDGRLTKTEGGAFDGRVAPGAPAAQVNLGGEVDLPAWMLAGVTLTGRVIYTSSQVYDQANTQTIPDWVRLDLGIRYTFTAHGVPLTARLNVENAAGARFWAFANAGTLTTGTPRTFLASLTADF